MVPSPRLPIRAAVVAPALALIVSLLPVAAWGQAVDPTGVVMVQTRDGRWEPRRLSSAVEAMDVLGRDPAIIRVAPLKIYRELASEPPNDPAFDLQWHLVRNQASRSWQHADGSGVTIAVVDSGVADVDDLDCHAYASPHDFVDGDSNPNDATGHGTLVSQVIAECTNNGIFGAGVAPGATLMPLRVFNSSGVTDSFLVYEAINWAVNEGADVINLSLGASCGTTWEDGCFDLVIDTAIEEATAAGVLVVAAAGNDGGPFLAYPANHPYALSVGATGHDGTVASYSSRGEGLEIVAPTGDDDDPAGLDGVIHQGSSGNLTIVSGTSFAAPQVTAAYAILLSAGAEPNDALEALLESADDIGPSGYDVQSGYGELRIRDALAHGAVGATAPMGTATFNDAGDLTGDGKADSVVYDETYGRWWGLTSTGSEFAGAQWARFTSVAGWSTHVAGDFTEDDKTDFASFHPSNGTWWVSRSTGSTFATTEWADFATASGWGAQLVGDFNGDGRDDIANYYPGNGTWWVSRSTGSGFSTTLWADFATAGGWQTHVVGDFNDDGRDDIASFHPSNGTWWVSLSNGTGFSTGLWADFATASGWGAQLVGDFNNDGRDDIANYYPGNGTWWVSLSTPNGFSTGLWADFATASGWGAQLVGDFDGDDRDDIANYYPGNGTWWVSRSTGTSLTTKLWADFATTTGWTGHSVGDFTGDGRDDIANSHANGTWWVSRSAGSHFSTSAWYD